MSHYKQHMDGLQKKVNFLKLVEKNKSTFDFSNSQYRNTFYNDHENGLVGSRPNRPSDYTTQQQRVSNSVNIINSSNQYIRSATKSMTKSNKK